MVMILLELSFIMDKKKEGIALFITLMVIASIMSIIAVSFSYLEKVQKDAGTTSAIIQGDLLYNNTIEVLKRFFPAKSDNSDKLEIIYTMPLSLSEPKSGFNINLSCEPLMVGAPISWLDRQQTKLVPEKTSLAKDILEHIMEIYDIENPNRLEEMILQSITGRTLENIEYEPRLQPKKGTISKKQFKNIIIDYFLLYDDPKVLTVPWEKYFSFVKIDKTTKIDGTYISPEFISVAFDIPIEIIQDSWIIGESTLSSFLKENGISTVINKKIYANKALNAMHCEQSYLYQDKQYKFNFNYIEGRSSNFEFNGEER